MQFKRHIALSLSIYYVVCVIGLALSMHFCAGKLAAVNIGQNNQGCKLCAQSTKLKLKKDNNCCKNTTVELKVEDQHQLTDSFKLPKLFPITIWGPFNKHEIKLSLNEANLAFTPIHGPPLGLVGLQKIYIQNQVFRI